MYRIEIQLISGVGRVLGKLFVYCIEIWLKGECGKGLGKCAVYSVLKFSCKADVSKVQRNDQSIS